MQAFESSIIRVNTGYLNTVADTVPGGTTSGMAGTGGNPKFGGQLGKQLAVSTEMIAQLQNTSVGTLYAGVYQYVRMALDLGTPEPVIGQALWWDLTADPDEFVVTDTDTTTAAPQCAGVYIGGPAAGEYGFIQIAGVVRVKIAASLTNVGQSGQGLSPNSAGLWNNTSVLNPVYAAYAMGTPANFTLVKAQLSAFLSLRG